MTITIVCVSAFKSVAQTQATKGRYECTNSLNLNHTCQWCVSGAVNWKVGGSTPPRDAVVHGGWRERLRHWPHPSPHRKGTAWLWRCRLLDFLLVTRAPCLFGALWPLVRGAVGSRCSPELCFIALSRIITTTLSFMQQHPRALSYYSLQQINVTVHIMCCLCINIYLDLCLKESFFSPGCD